MEKIHYHVTPPDGGVFDVWAESAEKAIAEIADEIYGGDKTGLSAEVAPKAFMIYKNGKMMSAMPGHTSDEAIGHFVSMFGDKYAPDSEYTAKEITTNHDCGDDGYG